jgi:hypothetical protein
LAEQISRPHLPAKSKSEGMMDMPDRETDAPQPEFVSLQSSHAAQGYGSSRPLIGWFVLALVGGFVIWSILLFWLI